MNGKAKFVRSILFNKTSQNNWLVSWHQDKTVAVSERFEKPGWGPWSTRDRAHHVQPPLEVLNQMITFRIHLDQATKENGCMKVVPRSHTCGVIVQNEIRSYVNSHEVKDCVAKKGSALVMRPHLIHSSSKGTLPSQRRILHIEFSSFQLPAEVEWA